MRKRRITMMFCIALLVLSLAGCAAPTQEPVVTGAPVTASPVEAAPDTTEAPVVPTEGTTKREELTATPSQAPTDLPVSTLAPSPTDLITPTPEPTATPEPTPEPTTTPEPTPEPHTHSYSEKVTAPTCMKKGYTTYTCECGDSYKDDETEATGHSFTNYVYDNNATKEYDGTETAKCDNSGCEEYNWRSAVGTRIPPTWTECNRTMYAKPTYGVSAVVDKVYGGTVISNVREGDVITVTGISDETHMCRILWNGSDAYMVYSELSEVNPIPSPTPAYTFKETDLTMYATGVWKMYDIPDDKGVTVDETAKGDRFAVTGICNETGWYEISYKQQSGYVPKDALTDTRPELVFTDTERRKMWIKIDDDHDAVWLYDSPYNDAEFLRIGERQSYVILDEGAEIILTGTSEDTTVCRVEYYGETAYVDSAYLTDMMPEDGFLYNLYEFYTDESEIYFYGRQYVLTPTESEKISEMKEQLYSNARDRGEKERVAFGWTNLYSLVRAEYVGTYNNGTLTVYKYRGVYYSDDQIVNPTEDQLEQVELNLETLNRFKMEKISHIRTYRVGDASNRLEEIDSTWYVANVDLKQKTDVLSIENDPTGTARNFEDCFGFDYKDYDNNYDATLALKEVQGFDCDFLKAARDNFTYFYAGQLYYNFEEECSILRTMKQELKEKYGCEEFTDCNASFEVFDNRISEIGALVRGVADGIEYYYRVIFYINEW